MELFAAAGIELPPSGGRARRAPSALVRSLRVPLFNYKVVEEALGLAAFAPTPDEVAAAADYARKVNSPRFLKQKETAVRPVFIEQILGKLLGYTTLDPERPFSLAFEHPIRRGAVDVGLGSFNEADGSDRLVAPFELKGPEIEDSRSDHPRSRAKPGPTSMGLRGRRSGLEMGAGVELRRGQALCLRTGPRGL